MSAYFVKDLDINPRISDAAIRGGLINLNHILETSIGGIKSRTGLKENDVELLVSCAAKKCCPNFITVLEKHNESKSRFGNEEFSCIKIGCPEMDKIMGGGIALGKIIEVVGESSSGKTQLALTLAIQAQLETHEGGVEKGVAYICTETQFPMVRLNQMLKERNVKPYNGKSVTDNILIHHVPDMKDLLDCVSYQLPRLVTSRNVGLIVIDSVAAVFRADEGPQRERSKAIQKLGFKLHQLASTYNVAIVPINQVTGSFSTSMYGLLDDFTAALGLAWANFVTTRLMLRKSSFSVTRQTSEHSDYEAGVRSLEVVFCPWLPRKTSYFVITQKGIEDIQPLESHLNVL